MNLKMLINKKIQQYDNLRYQHDFYRILKDLADGKIEWKEEKKKKIDSWSLQFERKSVSNWHILLNAIEDEHPKYSVSNVVYFYLLKKARMKFDEILKFSKKEDLSYLDVVRLVIFYFYSVYWRD